MQYHEYQPSSVLSQYVINYWYSDNFGMLGVSQKILPNPCADIIFVYHKDTGIFVPLIYGLQTKFIDYNYPDKVQMFGIRFKPQGLIAFTKVALSELTDLELDLSLVPTLFTKELCERILGLFCEEKDGLFMSLFMDKFLTNCLPNLYSRDLQIAHSADFISKSKGLASVEQVASNACLGLRHFERKFKQIIGVSPKKYAKIVQFDNAINYIQENEKPKITRIAEDCGYYDHAHLIKDFKQFADGAPSEFYFYYFDSYKKW